jgi:hypothetical protein
MVDGGFGLMLADLRRELDDSDLRVTCLLAGGHRPAEIRQRLGLSAGEYDAATGRIAGALAVDR